MLRAAASGAVRGLGVVYVRPAGALWRAAGTSNAGANELDIKKFTTVAEETLEQLTEQLDLIGEQADLDVTYANGVLTLKVGEIGTFVINKQPPNKQIWLSSPLSGPKRFDFTPVNSSWTYTRTNENLVSLLNAELSAMLQKPVTIEVSLDA